MPDGVPVAQQTDQELAAFLYHTLREKGAPKWASLLESDRVGFVQQVALARARAHDIAARPPLVGRSVNPHPKEQSTWQR